MKRKLIFGIALPLSSLNFLRLPAITHGEYSKYKDILYQGYKQYYKHQVTRYAFTRARNVLNKSYWENTVILYAV
jgi:hypothetical protein